MRVTTKDVQKSEESYVLLHWSSDSPKERETSRKWVWDTEKYSTG